jgi:hypothetical protein
VEPGSPSPLTSRRAAAARAAVLVGAAVVGWGLARGVAARVEDIQSVAQHDLIAARAELARLLQRCAVAGLGATALFGAAIAHAGWRSLALSQFPPPGVWAWGAPRIATGPSAHRLARTGLVLGILLLLLSAAAAGLLWYMAEVLLACRAGVPPR